MNSNKLPNGWKIEKLENLAIVSSGQGAPQNKSDYGDEGYPFVKASHLELLCNGGNEETIPKINNEVASDKKLKLYDKGTIIFAKSGMSCMKERVCAINEPCYIVNHLACIMPKAINSKYLMYFLKKNPPTRLIKDMSYPSIRLSDIAEMKIIVPPEKIQNNIVDILEKSKGVLEKRKEAIDLLDELVKSKFIEMFGDLNSNSKEWNILNFNEFAVIDTNMTKDFEKYSDYPHIGIDSIEKNTGNILEYQLVKDSSLKSGKYLFDERHIIYSKIRPNLNKVALPQFKGVCSADAYPILCLEGIVDRNYLGYVLRSEFFLNYILAFSGRTNIPKVNKEQLKGFSMPTPPIELQNQFADFVKQTDKLKFKMEKSLKELENNFNSLMQKAFNGELLN